MFDRYTLAKFWLLFCGIQVSQLVGQDFGIASLDPKGSLAVTNAFTNGIVQIEFATSMNATGANWMPTRNFYSTASFASGQLAMTGMDGFYRARAVDLSDSQLGFSNLVTSYGVLSTIAGAGGATSSHINKWLSDFEGGPATNALLSRPHNALGDNAGNLYIVDKVGDGIRKVTPDGIIVTIAGTSVLGTGPDDPTPGTQVALNNPNGLWVRGDGTVYVLDTGNARVRKLDTNGIMRTMFTVPEGYINGGRAFWVSDDESVVYFGDFSVLKRWTALSNVIEDFATGFAELGNIIPDLQGNMLVTDYGANLVYRISPDGQSREVIAGNGLTWGAFTNGMPATNAALWQVRGVWCMPTGALLLGAEGGSQVWYVDTQGHIYLLVTGAYGGSHNGDGDWFYQNPDLAKVSSIRNVTMDHFGNILITENDSGYVRMIRFLPFH